MSAPPDKLDAFDVELLEASPVGGDAGDAGKVALVVPQGWRLADLARDRLEWQLGRAPGHVVGIVATTGDLLPGSSYRTHAERLATAPLDAVEEHGGAAPVSAAVLRTDAWEVRDGAIETAAGILLVDRGAHAHDPDLPVADLTHASPLSRSPFGTRPVVAVVSEEDLGDDEALATRDLVNALVARGVEARLLLPRATTGPHLTRPCRPTAESFAALVPDVVLVPAGARAADAVQWCVDRSAALVELGREPVGIAPATWRSTGAVVEHPGLRHARVAASAGADEVADLVNRLVALAPPLVRRPRGTPVASPAALARAADPSHRRRLTIAHGTLDTPTAERVTALADAVRAGGDRCDLVPLATFAGQLDDAEVPVLLLAAPGAADDVRELIAARAAGGRPTILDLGPADLEELSMDRGEGDHDPATVARLSTRAWRRIAAGALVTTPSPLLEGELAGQDLWPFLLPPLLPAARRDQLDAAASGSPRSPGLVGWHLGSVLEPGGDHIAVVADALTSMLADRPDLELDLVGDVTEAPPELLLHDRVSVAPGEPSAERIASWSTQLWTPAVAHVAATGAIRPFLEASYLGIPTVAPASEVLGVTPLVLDGLGVLDPRRPDAWREALRRALVHRRTSVRDLRLREVARLLLGATAAAAAADQLFEWSATTAGGTR